MCTVWSSDKVETKRMRNRRISLGWGNIQSLSLFGGYRLWRPCHGGAGPAADVKEKGWLNQKDFLDGLALCQMVPGATVVQLATYVGYLLGRTPGALAAAAGFILPAFILMLGLSALYFAYGNIAWVKSVSRGLGVVVIALLLQAVWRLGPES